MFSSLAPLTGQGYNSRRKALTGYTVSMFKETTETIDANEVFNFNSLWGGEYGKIGNSPSDERYMKDLEMIQVWFRVASFNQFIFRLKIDSNWQPWFDWFISFGINYSLYLSSISRNKSSWCKQQLRNRKHVKYFLWLSQFNDNNFEKLFFPGLHWKFPLWMC